MKLILRIPGCAIPKLRHRTSNGRAYNPQQEAEEYVRRAVKEQLPADFELIRGPVIFSLSAYFPRPVSHYGTGKNEDKLKPSAPSHHTVKPDYSNASKFYEDCLNKLVYLDDVQIIGYDRGAKYWLEKDKFGYVELCVKEILSCK